MAVRDFRQGEEKRGGRFPQNGRVFLPASGGSASKGTVFQFQRHAHTEAVTHQHVHQQAGE